jgi:hypothetical protein
VLIDGRPSIMRIRQLEAENAKLRESRSDMNTQNGDRRTEAVSSDSIVVRSDHPHDRAGSSTSHPPTDTSNVDASTASSASTSRNATQNQASRPTNTQFHGPTSAMFDENPSPTQPPGNHTVSNEYARNMLLAQSTRQRLWHRSSCREKQELMST